MRECENNWLMACASMCSVCVCDHHNIDDDHIVMLQFVCSTTMKCELLSTDTYICELIAVGGCIYVCETLWRYLLLDQ